MGRFLCCVLLLLPCFAAIASSDGSEDLAAAEEQLSDQIRAVIKHFQQEDPVGLPGAPVPDPMAIPDMKKSFSVATMNFKNVNVYGQSKFRIERMHSDLGAMKMLVVVRISTLYILGHYTMSALWTRSQGRFNVTIVDVVVEGEAKLTVQRSGHLEAQDIDTDISFSDITVDFENLGFLGSIFQGIINSVGSFLFDSIKPFILKQVNQDIRGDINKNVEKIAITFPNSISPFDMAVAEARRYIRDQNYDPFNVPDYNYTAGLLSVYLTHTWLQGMSTVYRVGNVTVTMEKRVVFAAAHVGTQLLRGQCLWEVSAGGLLSRAGTASFTVDYLHVMANLSQPLDTRQTPVLEHLDIALGNIQARVDGAGTLDYVVEFMVNVLPNLLRYQIVNAVEQPLKKKVQAILNETNVERMIEQNIPELERALSADQ